MAFASCKEALAEATMLSHPKHGAHISLTTDASDQAVGGVFEQYVNGIWQPLAFFSKRLRPPEMRYSTFDRELLALYLAITHFRFFLEGRSFTAYTDHKPWWASFQNCLIHGQHGSNVILPSYHRTQQIYAMFPGNPT
ncbi:Pol polyprotein [Plakobranchus ocellatus]|uniref:Pol polyprotein n=1 Tax=Plakobranchus ocellatus TaxID=259542 RepID=A0AAV3YRY1_9GAST|nr:Pol polyprotein [Plakobranchus ocellatus]